MLYHPKWDSDNAVPSHVLTNSSFIAWLEQQPADEAYPYADPCNCALAQYFSSHGVEHAYVTKYFIWDIAEYKYNKLTALYPHNELRAGWDDAVKTSLTFGEVLEKIKAL
jgi:hypothetical protein